MSISNELKGREMSPSGSPAFDEFRRIVVDKNLTNDEMVMLYYTKYHATVKREFLACQPPLNQTRTNKEWERKCFKHGNIAKGYSQKELYHLGWDNKYDADDSTGQ